MNEMQEAEYSTKLNDVDRKQKSQLDYTGILLNASLCFLFLYKIVYMCCRVFEFLQNQRGFLMKTDFNLIQFLI